MVSGKENKCSESISRFVMLEHQLKASNQLPGLAPFLGGEIKPLHNVE